MNHNDIDIITAEEDSDYHEAKWVGYLDQSRRACLKASNSKWAIGRWFYTYLSGRYRIRATQHWKERNMLRGNFNNLTPSQLEIDSYGTLLSSR